VSRSCITRTVSMCACTGLEDMFYGSYFHSMPQMELGSVGFHLDNSSICPTKNDGPNTLAAYRILTNDPVLFSDSIVLQWQPHDESAALTKAGFPLVCNDASSASPHVPGAGSGWPPTKPPVNLPNAQGDRSIGIVQVTSYAWVYTY
jgi:hypothetical protein